MEIAKLILDWTASIAWPTATLVIAVMVRKPFIALLSQIACDRLRL